MPAYLALLRGINVGGKNKLPMKDLVRTFQQAGCESVSNYIQSGNIVFDAVPSVAAGLPERIADRIAEEFGIRVPVVLRTAQELAAVVQANPYVATGVDEAELHVYFLAGVPDPPRVAALDPGRSPPDTFAVIGREVYLRLPQGMARTKLTNAYFDSRLATISTARNWRTVRTLLELLHG